MTQIPPLSWLRAFEASAQHCNFSVAADELGLTPAAVSYQVRSLEEHLGYALFDRKKRPMALTTMGQLYLPWVVKSFDTLRQGTLDVFGARDVRPVRIRCLQSFAQLWLIPHLPDFRAQHPEVILQLHTGSWSSTLSEDQLDIDIRFGNGQWPGQRVVALAHSPIIPVCAPALQVADSAALAQQPLIEITGVSDTWQQFFLQEQTPAPQTPVVLYSDQSVTALEMAALGMGHVLVSQIFAQPYLDDGRLVRSIAGQKVSDQGLYLVMPDVVPSYGAQLFLDWITDQLPAAARS